MLGKPVGYEFLRDRYNLPVLPVAREAREAAVKRIVRKNDALEVPQSVCPGSDGVLEHLLFALKHEGVNLQVLSAALPLVRHDQMREALIAAPTSKYLRVCAYLWEQFCQQDIEGVAVSGPYEPVFDPDRYLTGEIRRSSKWRVDFNGLGDLRYCPWIERTEALETLLALDTLERTRAFTAGLSSEMLERTLSWSYLSETQSSYSIEREVPSASKAQAFAKLLQQAHLPEPITQEYLVELQHLAVSNPVERDYAFRDRQNWLRRSGSNGVLSVSYVPPPPELAQELMECLMAQIQRPPAGLNPIVHGALVSFGFVFVHPFMDGNGRLSRFLFHKAMCQSEYLQQGVVLPISTAMKRHEDGYLKALQSFSAPARRLWDIREVGPDRFDCRFEGAPAVYRYWDATPCAVFGLQMAEQALQTDLMAETEYLQNFDRIRRNVSEELDFNDQVLATMIRMVLGNGGALSLNKRKALQAKGYPCELLDRFEAIVQRSLRDDEPLDAEEDGIPDYDPGLSHRP